MSTYQHLLLLKRAGVVLTVSIALFAPGFAMAQSTTSSTPSAGSPATPSQPAAGFPTAGAPALPSQPATGSFATNRDLVNPTNRNQVAIRPGAVISTRSLSEGRRGGTIQGTTIQGTTIQNASQGTTVGGFPSTTSGLTTQQQATLRQQLAGMDSRLDNLIDAVNDTSGTQRDQALATVVQELATQISAIRQALLASGFSSFERLADGRTIFITPSSVQSRDRRVNGLDTPSTAGSVATVNTPSGVPLLTNDGAVSSPVSGMSMQAAQRRGGDPNEPVVASEGG